MAANFDGSSMKEFKYNCILGETNYNWDRRVKRKVEDIHHEVKRASDNAEAKVELLSELESMKEALHRQQITIEELSSELDEERNAAASAAEEAMTFISRLQKEKAQVHMEASQFRRYAEGKFAHDQQELVSLENLLYRKEQMIKALELEVQSFKHRLLSIGGYEYENVNRSPDRSCLDEVDDHFYLTESSGRGKNSSAEQDSLDFYDRQMRDSVYRQAKETNSRRICQGKLSDTQDPLQPHLEWEDTFSPRILQVQERGSCSSHPLQLDDYTSSSQWKGHTLNGRNGLQKSDVHDSKAVEINSVEKSLWEYVERLEERLQQLERGTHSEHSNSEWIEMSKLRPKHLSLYSDEFIGRHSPDSVYSSDKLVEASKDSSKEEDELLIVKANGLYSGKKSIDSQVMDNMDDKKSSMSNIFENPNDNSKCAECKPMKGNVGCIGECNSLPWKHEACTATKVVLKIQQETHLPCSREGAQSPRMLSGDVIKESYDGNDELTTVKMMREGSKTGNPALAQAVDDLNNKKYSISDVPDGENDDAGSAGCKALKGNLDWCGDPGPDSSPQRHIGQPEKTPDHKERSEGSSTTAFSVALRTELHQSPVQSEIKQLILRIRALEDERQLPSGHLCTSKSKTATFRSLCFRESYKSLGYGAYLTSVGIGGKTSHYGRVVSPRAVSDSRNSDPCLDPDVSKSVLGIILGAGAGTRLYPLTKSRAKPAVPLGANYRLIDIPISNCINSNITKVYVLTQFNSASLNRHISQAYDGNTGNYRNEGFVEVLAAQQSPENPNWFQGTADSVRKYLWLLDEHPVMEFLILAGDHLYRMDYQNFIRTHRESHADITVAALPVDEKRAGSLGLMKIDNEGHIVEFVEKPKGEKLKAMAVETSVLGVNQDRAKELHYIASMGIYVISKEVMKRLLNEEFLQANDFASEIIPNATSIGMRVQAYLFDGYWEDIGTIDSFYHANLRLTMEPVPDFSFYDRSFPIYTKKRFLPPSKMLDAKLTDSLIGEGCIVKNCKIIHSVVGLRSWIEDGAIIEDSLLMGADYYETDEERSALMAKNGVQIGVGRNTHVRRAIIDKNVRIGDNVKIINADNVQEADRGIDGYFIRSGIVTVIKNALIPSGTII